MIKDKDTNNYFLSLMYFLIKQASQDGKISFYIMII